MREGYSVFDTHSHIGEWGSWKMKGYEVDPFSREFTTKQDLRDYMSKYGVDKQIVMPHYHPDMEITFSLNQLSVEMTEIANVYGGVFFDPTRPESLEDVKKYSSEDDIKVLKTSADTWQNANYSPETWENSTREYMESVIELARDQEMVFQLHTGSGASDPRNVFDMVDRYPEAKYHLVHMGGTSGGHFALVPRFLERVENHQIYCDTSWSRGFGPRWLSRELKKKDALDRIMLGTDEPWGDFSSEFHKITGLKKEVDLTDDEIQMILHENASNLYE